MKRLALILSLLASPALAQSTAIEFTDQEQQFLLQMCEAAKWSARIQFDTACDTLKLKFAGAKSAANKSDKDKTPAK